MIPYEDDVIDELGYRSVEAFGAARIQYQAPPESTLRSCDVM